jgi:hypothetical protein
VYVIRPANGSYGLRRIGKARVADFFVSYTRTDCDWAFWIANELEALGHMPHVHEWEINGGDDIYAWMEKRHAGCRPCGMRHLG